MSNKRKIVAGTQAKCKRCHTAFVKNAPMWKCCSRHTSAHGPDFICDNCAVRLHPDKAAIVRHKMFGPDGILPCCGLHRLEARQSDQVTTNDQEVTCTGKKRYTTFKDA